MAVSSINNNSGTDSGTGTGSSAADLSDQFMNLLVAQMKNQDPTNPMDNNQLTSQLAQFNMAAGVEKLNTSVAGVQAMMIQLGSMSASSWVGRSVLIEGEAKVSFGEAPIGIQQEGIELPGGSDDFHFAMVGDAKTVTVTLTDSEGNAYTSELKDVKSGMNTYNLDDLENFKPEPGPPRDREYTVSYDASNPEGDKPEIIGLVQDQVQGITMDPSGPILHLLNNDPIGINKVFVIQK
ncbi:flagellar basal body rod modification protein FlgD [Enterobacter hormaechei subsp. hoffmannii]|uniref:flagellar hook assembly protein FlgD n=1 Tax=Enterobacter hormaechei TaxID=158836 RepID=UPI0006276804|nr:flagellar hook capping FlgD N-terminal domain-containing protein [Enterobacter hormaechei]KKJ31800.1 flagellar basal body rod modification protein FlgD [Enterobacter hormaechei subsp. hoffmannii]